MADIVVTRRRPRGRLRSLRFWLLLLFIVLEEVSPFVPLCGLVIVAGFFVPRVLLWTARQFLRMHDDIRGTCYTDLLDEARGVHPGRAA